LNIFFRSENTVRLRPKQTDPNLLKWPKQEQAIIPSYTAQLGCPGRKTRAGGWITGTGRPMHGPSWALGPSFLGLPVVVAGAGVLVAVGARRHAQALGAALVAEEEARLLVVRLGAPPLALPAALCNN
jgi:hypothetical protein